MIRTRTERRRRAREEEKRLRAVQRELAAEKARAVVVNRIIAPTAPLFWHVLKARIAARESLCALRDRNQIRDIALGILAEEGADMTGLVLKVEWYPPALELEAVPEHGTAVAAVERVDARAR